MTDVPLLRHYSSTFKFHGAVPGGELVVRMISSVYNYDYIQVGVHWVVYLVAQAMLSRHTM
jgi:Cu2+-containing amine oxidase